MRQPKRPHGQVSLRSDVAVAAINENPSADGQHVLRRTAVGALALRCLAGGDLFGRRSAGRNSGQTQAEIVVFERRRLSAASTRPAVLEAEVPEAATMHRKRAPIGRLLGVVAPFVDIAMHIM